MTRQVLNLYKQMLKDAGALQNYNFRSYATRRVRTEFRLHQNASGEEARTLVQKAQEQAQVLHRQSIISSLYPGEASVMDNIMHKL